jgi:hypothetical protein
VEECAASIFRVEVSLILYMEADHFKFGFEVLTAVVLKSTIFWDITDYTALYPRGWYSSL